MFALAPDDLTSLHRSVDLGPRGVIALVGTDGMLRARFGDMPDGTPPAGGKWPVMLDPRRDRRRRAIRRGRRRCRGSRSLRRLPDYPLIVAAGLSLDDEVAESRTHLILEVGIGVAASVLLIALNMLLLREIRRRNQRELELAREHAALESARAELLTEQGKLASVNQELVLSTERAEAANLAKSQFLAQMSHELRTPLHAVIGFSELISHHVAPMPSAGQVAGYADDIMKSGRHLLELINSILDLSKVESGSASLAEDDVPLARGDPGQPDDDPRAGARGGRHGRNEPAGGDAGDPRRYHQTAADFHQFAVQRGEVHATRRLADGVGTAEPDGGFAVMVADTGIGMTEAEMGIAMEPFGQVENSLARSFEGTGLGLPLARRMIELHGGRLTLRSVKGVGTTVEVYLPAEPDSLDEWSAEGSGREDRGLAESPKPWRGGGFARCGTRTRSGAVASSPAGQIGEAGQIVGARLANAAPASLVA